MGFLDFLTKTTKTEPDQQAKVGMQSFPQGIPAAASSAGVDFLRCPEAGIESAFQISRVFVNKVGTGFSTISAAAEQACQFFSESRHHEGRELFSRILERALDEVPSSSTNYAKEVYERIQEYLFVAEIAISRPGATFEDAFVQKALASMYCHGDGVAQNYRKAKGWYERAAALNDSAAIFNLGTMFQNGEGVPVDMKKAAELYLRSAQLGNIGASAMVGYRYLTGEGLPQDFGKAAYWFAISAKSGDAYAQANLGHLYWVGRGVKTDRTEAIAWMYLAANSGFDGAAQQLTTMETQVPQAVVTAARARMNIIKSSVPKPVPDLKQDSPPSTAVEPFQIEVVAQRMSALVKGVRWTGNRDPLDAEGWGSTGRVVGNIMLDGSEVRCALTEMRRVSGRVIMLSVRLFPCSEEYLLDECFRDIFSRFKRRTGSKHLSVSWLGRPTFATLCCDAEEGALGFTDQKLLLSHELTSRLAPFFRDSLSSLNVIRQRDGCNSAESQHAYSMFSKSLDNLLDAMPLEVYGKTLSE